MIKEIVNIPYYNSNLSAMFFYPNNGSDRCPVVCKAHGLISNKFEKEEELATMLTDEGIAYFTFHFTGFFESTGDFRIQTQLTNLDYIITYLTNHPKVDPKRIGLLGVSMGAAIAVCHASRDPRISSVVLQAPLFDFDFVVNYPEFTAMMEGLALTGMVRLPLEGAKEELVQDIKGNNPLHCINRICPRPLLIIAGENDTFMPLSGIKKLFEKAQSPKEFKLVENADHNLSNYFARFETFNLIKEFFIDNLKHIYLHLSKAYSRVSVI
ncbi:MAG: alpha/beta hydrolase [Candidatus Heimdallarchaeota archaeon]|nr:alpha/beta hydrolase [Candidatus Heimdallarchaeota archaeon]MCK4290095.1 alpha/beta hydrolase [Candidatus Heimdallarchaeota archaeon]